MGIEKSESPKHNRRSIRIKGFDYSSHGWYYITICTNNGKCLFGKVINGKVVLNDAGINLEKCWLAIPKHYPDVELDEFVIMPNHLHGIIVINKDVGVQDFEPLQHHFQHIIPRSVGSIVRGFKIGVTKWFHQNTKIDKVWQRNFYEHIIRKEDNLFWIRHYIEQNPLKWSQDKYFKE